MQSSGCVTKFLVQSGKISSYGGKALFAKFGVFRLFVSVLNILISVGSRHPFLTIFVVTPLGYSFSHARQCSCSR